MRELISMDWHEEALMGARGLEEEMQRQDVWTDVFFIFSRKHIQKSLAMQIKGKNQEL